MSKLCMADVLDVEVKTISIVALLYAKYLSDKVSELF